jgi:cyclophilin family peptidyl-prolyl cis-trans isomerase
MNPHDDRPPPQPPSQSGGAGASLRNRLLWIAAGVLVAAVLNVSYRMWNAPRADRTQEEDDPIQHVQGPDRTPPRPAASADKKGSSDSFLDAFNEKEPEPDKERSGPALSNAELEQQFQALAALSSQLEDLKRRAQAPGALADDKEIAQAKASGDRLLEQLNGQAQLLEKELPRARRARPEDAVPRWLTGELLTIIGGEPDEILPHLQYALGHGLTKPRLLGSLARARLRGNEFAASYQTAAQALDQSGQDRYVWNAFMQAAVSMNQFDQVVKRLDRAFPAGAPDWARAMRRDAQDLQDRWEAEQKLRGAEARADDLPRVRLVIEHRRFGKDAAGQPLTTIESTGREEVVVELFENEAPNTVANFLELVSRKYYGGTRFHLALPATMIAGGDPNTKSSDPSDDGAGGPGYVIPDEFKSPRARDLFRGSLCMANTGPHTTGSQFFFALAPPPEKNSRYTVFGRVIQGQDAVDRITRGRTTRALGHYGKIIPGDLLVRAEVLRKRPHDYRVIKEQP